MSDKKKEKNDLSGPEIPLVLTLVSGAAWYKYGHRMEVWFHQNFVWIVLGGSALFSLLGYFIYLRMKKKNEEKYKRMKRLDLAKAQMKKPVNYYQRNRGKDHE